MGVKISPSFGTHLSNPSCFTKPKVKIIKRDFEVLRHIGFVAGFDKEENGYVIYRNERYDKLIQTSMRADFRKNDVKVLFMDAVDVWSDEKYVLQKENLLTVEEAIEKLCR